LATQGQATLNLCCNSIHIAGNTHDLEGPRDDSFDVVESELRHALDAGTTQPLQASQYHKLTSRYTRMHTCTTCTKYNVACNTCHAHDMQHVMHIMQCVSMDITIAQHASASMQALPTCVCVPLSHQHDPRIKRGNRTVGSQTHCRSHCRHREASTA